MLEKFKTTSEYNIYTYNNTVLLSDILYYVEENGDVHFFTNNIDGGDAKIYNAYARGSGQPFVPTGNVTITENGTEIDIANYATATVNVVPSGHIDITENGHDIDISDYATATVNVVPSGHIDITQNANNINVANYATASVSVHPTGNIVLTNNGIGIDVSDYATATVNVVPTGHINITQNGDDINVANYATASVHVVPSGTINITENGQGIDIADYARANINVVPTGHINITENGNNINVADYATASVSVHPTGHIDITQNGTNINVADYATATVNVSSPSANIPPVSSVTIGEGTTYIPDSAFEGWTSLEEVILPSTIEEIGDDAFKDTNVKTVIINAENPPSLGDGAFDNCPLEEIVIPHGSLDDYLNDEGWSNYSGLLVEAPVEEYEQYNVTFSTNRIVPDEELPTEQEMYDDFVNQIVNSVQGYNPLWMPPMHISFWGNDIVYNSISVEDELAIWELMRYVAEADHICEITITIPEKQYNGDWYEEKEGIVYAGYGMQWMPINIINDQIDIGSDDPSTINPQDLIDVIINDLSGYDPTWMTLSLNIMGATVADASNPTQNELNNVGNVLNNTSSGDTLGISLHVPQTTHDGTTYAEFDGLMNITFVATPAPPAPTDSRFVKAVIKSDPNGYPTYIIASDEAGKFYSYAIIDGTYRMNIAAPYSYTYTFSDRDQYHTIDYRHMDPSGSGGSIIVNPDAQKYYSYGIGAFPDSLAYITEIPNDTAYVYTYAFKNCTKASYLTSYSQWLNQVKYILPNSFYNCSCQKLCYVNDDVIYSSNALSGSKLKEFSYEGSYIPYQMFTYSNIEKMYLPNVTYVSTGAFASVYPMVYSYISSQQYYMPNVEVLGTYAFSGSGNYNFYATLTKVYLPNLAYAYYRAFYRCTKLTAAYLPRLYASPIDKEVIYSSDIEKCKSEMFNNCGALTYVDVPNLTYAGSYMFDQCGSLTYINASSMAYVGAYAFRGCYSLEHVYLPSSRVIYKGAFAVTYINNQPYALKTVTFGPNTRKIESDIFYNSGSTALRRRTSSFVEAVYCYAVTPPSVSGKWWQDRDKQCRIYVPAQSVSQYQTAWATLNWGDAPAYIFPMS